MSWTYGTGMWKVVGIPDELVVFSVQSVMISVSKLKIVNGLCYIVVRHGAPMSSLFNYVTSPRCIYFCIDEESGIDHLLSTHDDNAMSGCFLKVQKTQRDLLHFFPVFRGWPREFRRAQYSIPKMSAHNLLLPRKLNYCTICSAVFYFWVSSPSAW